MAPTIAPIIVKVRRRLLPFLFALYVVAFLDRANVAFAKMSMSADLKFSEAVFGLGAGIFFIGYLLLEIPGALIVERWSARKWLARILITWGFCTVLVGLVRTPGEFYAARFLLGCAEAGFYPGVMVYLGHWFPRRERAQAMSIFIMAIPACLVLGAPFSALLLRFDWLGLHGWQWIFILQGLPAILLGVVTPYYLDDRPKDAAWLEPEEKLRLTEALEAEQRERTSPGSLSTWAALRSRHVVLLAVALCVANIGSYSFTFWLPSLIRRSSGLTVEWSTAAAALPFAVGLVSVYLAGRRSDRSGERRLHTAIPLMLTGICFSLSVIPGQPFSMVMVWLCLTGAGLFAWPPPFWMLPSATLGGQAAAASIGLINSIGNLGGFIGPGVVGLVLSRNYSYSVAILFLSASFFLAGLLVLAVRVPRETG